MCAAKADALREKLAEEAKERQREAAARGGKASGSSRRGDVKAPENLPEPSAGDSRDQAGKLFGVSGRSVDYAAKVIENAVPEVEGGGGN